MSVRHNYTPKDAAELMRIFNFLREASPDSLAKMSEVPENRRIMLQHDDLLSVRVGDPSNGNGSPTLGHCIAGQKCDELTYFELLKKPRELLDQKVIVNGREMKHSSMVDVVAMRAPDRVVMVMLQHREFEAQLPLIAGRDDVLEAQLAIARMPLSKISSEELRASVAKRLVVSKNHEVGHALSENEEALMVKIGELGYVRGGIGLVSDKAGRPVGVGVQFQDPIFLRNYYVAHILLHSESRGICRPVVENIKSKPDYIRSLVNGDGRSVEEMLRKATAEVEGNDICTSPMGEMPKYVM